MAGKKSTNAEFENRNTEVYRFLLNGMTRQEILEKCSVWELTDRQVDTYIANAKEKIREHNAVERQDNMAVITANFWELYRIAKNDNDIAEARQILNSLAKLKGLEETTVNHIVSDPAFFDMPTEDLREKLEQAKDEPRH
jgi:hypothetical protein